MKARSLPATERLLEVLDYNLADGALTWKVTLSRRAVRGKKAGSLAHNGYIIVTIDAVRYYAHRLIWKMMTGNDPSHDIDHANRNKSDNSWANLRPASRTLNNANSVRTSQYGKGVKRQTRSSRFMARITASGVTTHLGTYDTAQDAQQAYAAAANAAFGQYARPTE